MMKKLMRPARQSGPMPPLGRTFTRPNGMRPAAPAPRPRKRAPQAFIQQQQVLLPDVPDGVVLDGKVTHLASPKPTIEKKYKE